MLDNGTMVEAFKYLNYCQLAKNSLVSKTFWNLIRNNRRRLALLYVHSINMNCAVAPAAIKDFDKELSPEAYNEWVIDNKYSKEAPLEAQVAVKQSTHNVPNGYHLSACANYKGPSYKWDDRTTVFFAQVELNYENWPVFQHFVRLATDPFIYIDVAHLTYQKDVLNLLVGGINSDHGRLQCKRFDFNLKRNSQKSLIWTKTHVRCNKLCITGERGLNKDEAVLDFVMTGAHCTSEVRVKFYKLSKAIAYFVQNFLDLKTWDEYLGIQSIKGFHFVKKHVVQVLKKDFANFFVKEVRNEFDASWKNTEFVFEFTNNAVGKKLRLTVTIFDHHFDGHYSADMINFP